MPAPPSERSHVIINLNLTNVLVAHVQLLQLLYWKAVVAGQTFKYHRQAKTVRH